MSFDGSNDKVTISADSNLDILTNGEDHSYEFVFYLNSLNDYNWLLAYDINSSHFINIFIDASGRLNWKWDLPSGDSRKRTDSAVFAAGQWYRLIMTKVAGADPIIYIGGVLDSTSTEAQAVDSRPNNTNAYVIGNGYDGSAQVIDGKIALHRFWNRILSPTAQFDGTIATGGEILQLFNGVTLPTTEQWGTVGEIITDADNRDFGGTPGSEIISDIDNRGFNTAPGSEIITDQDNRDFESTNEWANATFSIYNDSGDLSVDGNGGGDFQRCELPTANAPMSNGVTYTLTFDVANIQGSFRIRDLANNTLLGALDNVSANGTQEFTFTYAGSAGGFRVIANTGTSAADFDNFTLKPVADDWVNQDFHSYSTSGNLSVGATAAFQRCELGTAFAPMVNGTTYTIVFHVTNIVSSFRIRDVGDNQLSGALDNIDTNGNSQEFTFTYAGTDGGLRVIANAADSFADFNNISIKPVADDWENSSFNSYSTAGDLSVTANTIFQRCALDSAFAPMVNGDRYLIKFDVANIVNTFRIRDDLNISLSGALDNVSSNGTQQEFEFFYIGTAGGLRIIANSNTSSADFDNFTLFHIGVVAEYSSNGINNNNFWGDETDNDLNGVIAGATVKNIYSEGDLILVEFDEITARYWFFEANSAGFTTQETIALGQIAIGKKFLPSTRPDIQYIKTTEYGISASEGVGGRRTTNRRFDKRQRWEFTWQYIRESELALFEELFTTVEVGDRFSHYPLWFCINDGTRDVLGPVYYYGRIIGIPEVTNLRFGAFSLSMVLETEV